MNGQVSAVSGYATKHFYRHIPSSHPNLVIKEVLSVFRKNLRLKKAQVFWTMVLARAYFGCSQSSSYPDLGLLLDVEPQYSMSIEHRDPSSSLFGPLKLCRCYWDGTESVLLIRGHASKHFFRVRSTLSCCGRYSSKQLLAHLSITPHTPSLHQNHLTGNLTENNHQG